MFCPSKGATPTTGLEMEVGLAKDGVLVRWGMGITCCPGWKPGLRGGFGYKWFTGEVTPRKHPEKSREVRHGREGGPFGVWSLSRLSLRASGTPCHGT